MKILFPVGWVYPDQSGGPSNTVYWLAKALKQNNIDTYIVASDKGVGSLPINTWLDTSYGKVYYAKTRSYKLLINTISESIKNIGKVDIVHLTAVFNPLSFFLAIFALVKKKKVIWSIHGEFDESALIYGRTKKRLFLHLIRKLSIHVYFHSTCNQETVNCKRVIGDNTRIIQITNFMELPDHIISQNLEKKNLLYIGRIQAIKAIDNLIEAISSSELFKNSDTKLDIVGNNNNKYGQYLKDLSIKLRIQHKINFLGVVVGIEKEELFANAKVTILPSYTENFGLVVTESLAQSTPVIASTGTPWQILEENGVGFWVNNSPDSLKCTIENIMTMSKEKYDIMSGKARPFVEEKFDVYRNIHEWITTYKNILKN